MNSDMSCVVLEILAIYNYGKFVLYNCALKILTLKIKQFLMSSPDLSHLAHTSDQGCGKIFKHFTKKERTGIRTGRIELGYGSWI